MEYRETTDLGEVEEALADELRVYVRCGTLWHPVVAFHGVLYTNKGAEALPTMFGRIFRIEVKPASPKKRLERVELFRDQDGTLVYNLCSILPLSAHVCAVSEKGFNGYLYPDGMVSLRAVRDDGQERAFPVAFERWVEEAKP